MSNTNAASIMTATTGNNNNQSIRPISFDCGNKNIIFTLEWRSNNKTEGRHLVTAMLTKSEVLTFLAEGAIAQCYEGSSTAAAAATTATPILFKSNLHSREHTAAT